MLVAIRPGHGVAAATAGASAVKFGELPRLILQLREAHQEAGESIAGLPVYVRARPALRAAAEDHGQDVASRRQVDRCKAGHGSNAVIGRCDAPRRYQNGSQLRRCLKLASPWPIRGQKALPQDLGLCQSAQQSQSSADVWQGNAMSLDFASRTLEASSLDPPARAEG